MEYTLGGSWGTGAGSGGMGDLIELWLSMGCGGGLINTSSRVSCERKTGIRIDAIDVETACCTQGYIRAISGLVLVPVHQM